MKRFFTIVVFGVVAGCNPANNSDAERIAKDAERVAKLESVTKAVAEECKKNRNQINSDVEALIKSGNYVEARQRTARCIRFKDPDLIALNAKVAEGIAAARERELLAIIAGYRPTQYAQRVLYYAELVVLRPENKTYWSEWSKNRSALDRIEEQDRKKALAADRKALAADRAERRRKGVTIGMNRDEVLMSSWGRPEHVNTTTTARGTREQWVYGGSNYLYFENGVLSTIQN